MSILSRLSIIKQTFYENKIFKTYLNYEKYYIWHAMDGRIKWVQIKKKKEGGFK